MQPQKSSGVILACLIGVLLVAGAPFIFIQADYMHYNWRLPATDKGVYGESAMVVSAHEMASAIGRDILQAGGNAFDAAIAVHFALAVVYQQAGNIGGGGFMVYRLADGEAGALDFRETAPLAAHADMYLDEQGNVIKGKSLTGVYAVAVPGAVAGMAEIYDKFASQNWAELIAPSVKLARDGFVLTEKAARMFNRYQTVFAQQNRWATPVIHDAPWQAGDVIKFPVLATTLQRIAANGRDEFYKGETARALVDEMRAQGGLITYEDLAAYRAVWREPIIFDYRGHKLITMPPPSSGGVALVQLLKGIEKYDIASMRHNRAAYLHLLTELERRVYADRATHLGDTDFVSVNIAQLTNNDYITARMADISHTQKTDSRTIKAGHVDSIESVETTHISIVDSMGNAVAITTTLNGNFGSKVVVRDGGFFLNNEMDDFSIKPGHANQFGLVGADKNAIAPQKRMLSSMTPTIVEKDGALKLVVGTPGGATIITSIFQTLLNIIDFDMTAQQAVNARKSHHQWQPDMILLERGTPSLFTYLGLKRLGHRLHMWPRFTYELGRVEAILVHPDGRLEGAADYTRGYDDRAYGF